MKKIKFNDKDYKPREFKVAPGGLYLVTISPKSVLRPGKSGTNMNVQAAITKGPHKGISFFDTIGEHVDWKINQLLHALGLKTFEGTLKELVKKIGGKSVRVQLRVETFEGKKRNKVVTWLPLKGPTTTVDDEDLDDEEETTDDDDATEEDEEEEEEEEEDEEEEEEEEEEDEEEEEEEEEEDEEEEEAEEDEDETESDDETDDEDEEEEEEEEEEPAPVKPAKKSKRVLAREAKRAAAEAAASPAKKSKGKKAKTDAPAPVTKRKK